MNVDLVPEWTIGDLGLTSYPFSVDSDSAVDIGEPETVVETVTSNLADGALERVTRHGNRAYVLPLYIEGPTLGDLAAAEALLRGELRRPGLTLTHDPGDGLTPRSVYEVQSARLSPERRDVLESHLMRRFTLTLTCAPFARSVALTTVTALSSQPTSATTVTIANADTTAGWSASASGASPPAAAVSVVDEGANVRATGNALRPNLTIKYATTAVSLTGTPYLMVEMSGTTPWAFRCTLGSGFTPTISPVLTRATPSGTVLYVFDLTGYTDLTGFTASASGVPGAPASLAVHDVSRTNAIPQVTTRQNAAIIPVGGTERTPCSLQVIPAAAEALGMAIVHTSPAVPGGYSPALRQWRVSGNPETLEAASLSGKKEAVTSNPIVALMPIQSLPEDGYALMAYMRSSVAGTFPIVWQARTIVNGTNYLGGHEGVANVNFPTANTWTLVPLAVVTLPPVRAAVGGVVQFNITRTVGSEEIYLDEWWPFRIGDDCALTIVNSADGSFMWLDSPDSSSPVPRVWVGNNSDRSDQRHPGFGLQAQGNHVLTPGGTSVFVATSGIQSPAVAAMYHKRWHSNAAE